MLTIAREAVKTNRMDHLEKLFKKYPDVTKEVIVNADLWREGVQVTEAALDYGKGLILKTFQLFSWDRSPMRKMMEAQPVRLPNTFYGFGGPYNLRPFAITNGGYAESTYLLDILEGQPWFLDRATRTPLVQVEPWNMRNPEWYNKTFVDGSKYVEYQAVSVFLQCQYWGPEQECRYCDINENARTKKMLGQVISIQPRTPERMAEALWNQLYMRERECEYPEQHKDRHRYNTVNSGGTVIEGQTLRGMTDFEFYVRYTKAMRERMGGQLYIIQHSTPQPTEIERRYKEAGVSNRRSNIEVWDPRMFAVICPGKNQFVGRDEWIRRLINQVDVFGVGNVTPGFVAGVEMAQPWGFKTVEEAVASSTEGIDFLMRHGVTPRPIYWAVEALSALGGQTPPPVDYWIQLTRNFWELHNKYDMPPVDWTAQPPGAYVGGHYGHANMEWVVEGR